MVGGWAGGLTISRWAPEHGLEVGSAEPTLFVCRCLSTSPPPRPRASAFASRPLPALYPSLALLPCVPATSFLRCWGFSFAVPSQPGGCTRRALLLRPCYAMEETTNPLRSPCRSRCLLSQGLLQGWHRSRGSQTGGLVLQEFPVAGLVPWQRWGWGFSNSV